MGIEYKYVLPQNFAIDSRLSPEFRFAPYMEDVNLIREAADANNKNIISVCGYGYPLLFLSDEANHVLSFDNSIHAVMWNKILRHAISDFNFNEFIHFMTSSSGNRDTEIDYLLSCYENDDLEIASDLLDVFDLKGGLPSDDSLIRMPRIRKDDYFPFFNLGWFDNNRSQAMDMYNQVQKFIHQDRWEIQHIEFLDLLSQTNKKWDVIYASSIRNWINYYYFDDDYEEFTREYDIPLAHQLNRVLGEGGKFIDSKISVVNFSNIFPPLDYLMGAEDKKRSGFFSAVNVIEKYHSVSLEKLDISAPNINKGSIEINEDLSDRLGEFGGDIYEELFDYDNNSFRVTIRDKKENELGGVMYVPKFDQSGYEWRIYSTDIYKRPLPL